MIRFFYIEYGSKPIEIPLNRDNLFFFQLQGSIESIFERYNIPLPKIVFINKSYMQEKRMEITIVRPNLNTETAAVNYYNYLSYLKDELNRAAKLNEREELTFKFNII